jgi:hypothetical protein
MKYCTTVFCNTFWSSNLSLAKKFLNGLKRWKSDGARSGLCCGSCRTSQFRYWNQDCHLGWSVRLCCIIQKLHSYLFCLIHSHNFLRVLQAVDCFWCKKFTQSQNMVTIVYLCRWFSFEFFFCSGWMRMFQSNGVYFLFWNELVNPFHFL